MAFIYSMSDKPAVISTNESITVTEMLLNMVSGFIYVDPAKKAYIITAMEPHIRKIAHMTEFGILFLLLLIPASLFIKKMSVRPVTAFAISFLYGVSDEIHQLFVPGRAGMVRDVLIDMLGVVMALILYLVIAIPVRKRIRRKIR